MGKSKINEYVVVLCQQGSREVMSRIYYGYCNKVDVMNACRKEFPGWNIKGVWKLYDEDFAKEN